jgi:hypothetical protein
MILLRRSLSRSRGKVECFSVLVWVELGVALALVWKRNDVSIVFSPHCTHKIARS